MKEDCESCLQRFSDTPQMLEEIDTAHTTFSPSYELHHALLQEVQRQGGRGMPFLLLSLSLSSIIIFCLLTSETYSSQIRSAKQQMTQKSLVECKCQPVG